MILLDRQTDPRPTNLPTSNPSNLKDPTVPSILSFLNGMKRATGTGVNAIQLGLLEAWKTGGSRRSIEQKRTATSGKKAERTRPMSRSKDSVELVGRAPHKILGILLGAGLYLVHHAWQMMMMVFRPPGQPQQRREQR